MKKKHNIRLVIFDLDDTLYSEKQYVLSGFKAVSLFVAEKYDINKEKFYQSLLETFERGIRGNNFDVVLKKFNLYKKQLVLELIKVYRMHKPKLKLYQEVLQVLKELKKNYKLALLTDGYAKVQRKKVKALNIKRLFDIIVFSDDYGRKKWRPHTHTYNIILKKLNIKPQETVCVGDNPKKDFVGARKLGIHTIRVIRKDGEYANVRLHKDYEADYENNNLKVVQKILERAFK